MPASLYHAFSTLLSTCSSPQDGDIDINDAFSPTKPTPTATPTLTNGIQHGLQQQRQQKENNIIPSFPTTRTSPLLTLNNIIHNNNININLTHCSFPKSIRILEVSPRDGLQNEQQILPTSMKEDLIYNLSNLGLSNIEITSFVSPKWVPQLADAKALVTSLLSSTSTTTKNNYSVLIPNLHGYNNFVKCLSSTSMNTNDVKELNQISIFTSVSETFCKNNLNCSINDSIERYRIILNKMRNDRQTFYVRAYISCIVSCPYEGKINPIQVANLANILYNELGCNEIALADTNGTGDSRTISNVIDAIQDYTNVPISALAIHCHDTNGNALNNVLTAISKGISIVDGSIGGLGGCPFAGVGAKGNVATEDIVALIKGLNIPIEGESKYDSGKDKLKLINLVNLGNDICSVLDRNNSSRVASIINKRLDSGLPINEIDIQNEIVRNALSRLSLN